MKKGEYTMKNKGKVKKSTKMLILGSLSLLTVTIGANLYPHL